MSKYRPLNSGDVLPASFIAALQEYISTQAANLLIEASGTPPTSITAQAGTGSGQVALGIGGLWRYTTTTIVAAHPGGAAGTYDILAIASANSFGSPDTDSTDYAFGLRIVPAGGSSSGTLNGNAIVAERKVGTVLWDGSQIVAVTQTVGSQSSSRTQFAISPNPAITPQRVRGAAGQTSPLAVWETSAGAQRAAVGADGVFTALGYQVGGVPLAAGHLSNGVTGTGAVALADSPAFAGTPTAPTAAVDTNTTRVASTAFVLGQLSAAGDGTPAMDAAAARGTSLHGARADHVHPTDTSRAALVSPAFTGTPSAPTPPVDDNTTRLATTGYVFGQLSSAGDGTPAMDGVAARGASNHIARADHIHPVDTSRAPVVSPVFDGNIQFGGSGSGGHLNSFTPAYTLVRSNYWAATDRLVDTTRPTWGFELDGRSGFDYFRITRAPATTGAPVESQLLSLTPAGLLTVASAAVTTFTGTPNFSGAATGQTATPGDNTAKLATTAFVTSAVAAAGSPYAPSGSTPLMDGAAAVGADYFHFARADHVHPTDTSRAPTASPTFTGTVTANADIYARGTLVRLSDGPSGRGYVEVGGDGLTYMHSTAAGTLALQGSAIRLDAGSLGFFGSAPVGRTNFTGDSFNNSRTLAGPGSETASNVSSVLRQLLKDLASLGLITWQ